MKYLILGAGPAGLTVANRLLDKGIDTFTVLEQEKSAGGLCRSEKVDGKPLDLGGGHFLDVRRPEVNEFLFRYMPEDEWNKFSRNSQIEIGGSRINHPIEANIWQMEINAQVDYLKSIAAAGCNLGIDEPAEFMDWIYWKLGNKIADDYMIPYNTKMFADNLGELGTYWLEKLPNVSFEDTLRSCLEKKAYGEQPGHAEFYYPKKYGYGELWLRMAEAIGSRIEYNKKINYIDFNSKIVKTEDGCCYSADIIITTVPWLVFEEMKGISENLLSDIGKLKYSSVEVEYYPQHLETDAQWIYNPELNLPYHRILVRHNFCPESRGYWTETRRERVRKEKKETEEFSYMNKYAYPLNTVGKPEVMDRLLAFAAQRGVFGLGRWGEHCHYNSDLTVKLAMDLVNKLT